MRFYDETEACILFVASIFMQCFLSICRAHSEGGPGSLNRQRCALADCPLNTLCCDALRICCIGYGNTPSVATKLRRLALCAFIL